MVLFPILIAGVIYNVKMSLSTDKYGYEYMLPGMAMIIGVGFNIMGIAATYPYAWGA